MTKATVTASSTAPNGTQSLKIKETAKAGSLTGAQINASSSKTTLAQLGYTGGDAQINVNTGGTTKTITLSATSTMSDVEKQLKEEISKLPETALPAVKLTARELEIGRLTSQGLLSKEVADKLEISQRTVETHKNNLYRKLGINNNAELVSYMHKAGLL